MQHTKQGVSGCTYADCAHGNRKANTEGWTCRAFNRIRCTPTVHHVPGYGNHPMPAFPGKPPACAAQQPVLCAIRDVLSVHESYLQSGDAWKLPYSLHGWCRQVRLGGHVPRRRQQAVNFVNNNNQPDYHHHHHHHRSASRDGHGWTVTMITVPWLPTTLSAPGSYGSSTPARRAGSRWR